MVEPAVTYPSSFRELWLKQVSKSAHPAVRLICFPYAGGGASAYYPWGRELPAQIGVYAAQLPGREERYSETPLKSLSFLVESVIQAVSALPASPFALFGHSMGALLAFELAQKLQERSLPQPVHLFVSGRQSPRTPLACEPMHLLPDGAFLRECVRRYQGIPQAVLNEPELVKLFLPVLRADMEAVETYKYQHRQPLTVPVTALHGSDDYTSKPEEIQLWANETQSGFSYLELPGGHFFLQTARDQVLEIIRKTLLSFG